MPPSKAKQATVADRRREMLIMKIQGRTALEIAEHFDMSPNTARSDLSRAIRKAKDLESHEAGVYRFIQGARFEELLRAVWPAATGTGDVPGVDLKANEQARKILADINDLFGLKVPVRTEISGPDGGALQIQSPSVADLFNLIDTAGDDDQDDDGLPQEAVEEDFDDDGDTDTR